MSDGGDTIGVPVEDLELVLDLAREGQHVDLISPKLGGSHRVTAAKRAYRRTRQRYLNHE